MMLRCALFAVSLLLALPSQAQTPTDAAPTAPRRPVVYAPSLAPTDSVVAYDARYADAADRHFVTFQIQAGLFRTDSLNVQAPDGALVQGCDFDDEDFDRMVCISAAGGLFAVDRRTGGVDSIGTDTYAGVVADLTYSVVDDAWFALASDCSGLDADHRSSLARVDLATGSAEAVGPGAQTSFCGLGLAADRDGGVFAYSAETPAAASRLARIDPVTGGFEILGTTGVDVFYAQSMDCDASDGTCYAFAYQGSGANGLYQVNTTTGTFGLVGDLLEGAEMTAAAIAASSADIVSSESAPAQRRRLRIASATPARGTLRLAVGVDLGVLDAHDALGRRVASVPVGRAQTLTLDVSRWAPGVYVLRLIADGVSESRRVTVVR